MIGIARYLGLALVTLSLGCTADLAEGTYGCATGSCPSGWVCGPDLLCYSSEELAPLALYESCEVDADCASGSCLRAYDDAASMGQCSTDCEATSDCPSVDGRAGVCATGHGCLGACSSTSECDANQDCILVPMTMGETACMEVDVDGSESCMSSADCTEGAVCMLADAYDPVGVCTWPCTPGGECPGGADCLLMPTELSEVGINPVHACLAPCAGPPGVCSMALSCSVFPTSMAQEHCIAPGWAALVSPP